MKDNRNLFIDVLRGLAICDMILIHYANIFPRIVAKLIIYHDVALEGFLLLSGVIVGMHYLPLFEKNPMTTIKKIYLRVFKLCLIQYIMILTISLPEFILWTGETDILNIGVFLFQSFIFSNQIGLIHILPTFFPLFILTPLFLYFLSRNLDHFLLLGSIVFFLIVQKDPYLLSYGDKTIFPVILWQVYFVIGCCLGKFVLRKGRIVPSHVMPLFIISCIMIIIGLAFRHSTSVCPWLATFMDENDVVIRRFPLNAYGLVWGALLWLFLYASVAQFWNTFSTTKCSNWIALFGRNSLMTFILHVYFAKTISFIHILFGQNTIINYLGVLMNVGVTYYLLVKYEQTRMHNKQGCFLRMVNWMF